MQNAPGLGFRVLGSGGLSWRWAACIAAESYAYPTRNCFPPYHSACLCWKEVMYGAPQSLFLAWECKHWDQ